MPKGKLTLAEYRRKHAGLIRVACDDGTTHAARLYKLTRCRVWQVMKQAGYRVRAGRWCVSAEETLEEAAEKAGERYRKFLGRQGWTEVGSK